MPNESHTSNTLKSKISDTYSKKPGIMQLPIISWHMLIIGVFQA